MTRRALAGAALTAAMLLTACGDDDSGEAAAAAADFDRDAFCAQAEAFQASGPEDADEIPALRDLAAAAPAGIREDIEAVLTTFDDSPTSLTDAELSDAYQRMVSFLADTCAVDLRGVS